MKRPFGFTLIAFYCGVNALNTVYTAFLRDRYTTEPGPSGLSLLAAVFAAVAAEALWRCRPWCLRAFVGYVCIANVAWMAGAGNPTSAGVEDQLVSRLLIGLVAILYVRSRAQALFAPPARPRISIPAPRP